MAELDPNPADADQPFIAHLVELRDRLIKALVVVGLTFVGLSFWANEIYAYVAGPLTRTCRRARK